MRVYVCRSHRSQMAPDPLYLLQMVVCLSTKANSGALKEQQVVLNANPCLSPPDVKCGIGFRRLHFCSYI